MMAELIQNEDNTAFERKLGFDFLMHITHYIGYLGIALNHLLRSVYSSSFLFTS